MVRWKRDWHNPVNQSGTWWLAYSTEAAREVRRALEQEEASILVLENLEAVQETEQLRDGLRVVRVRLRTPRNRCDREWLDLTLSELGLGLIDVDVRQTT